MNSRVLFSAAFCLFGLYSIFQQVTSANTSVNVYGITMNKWIFVAIWVAIIYSSGTSIYKVLKASKRG